MPDLTFGVTIRDAQDLRAVVARADALGFDVLAVPDHLGAPEPFATLAAAAQLSPRLRLRTYVLNVGFWNPALLARAATTVDQLSGGRLELGLGAGHMRSEHEDAGLPYPPHRERIAQVEHALFEVRRRLDGSVPIVIGAMTAPGLRLAARHADIVAFSGLLQVPGEAPGTFTVASSAQTDAAVATVRDAAGGRPYRGDALLQAVIVGTDPADAARALAREYGMSAEALLDTPFVLIARDAAHAAEILAERRERYGFDGVTTHQPNLEALGAAIAAPRP